MGGLSGIDYDAGKNLYYLISDDRSERSPARFYTAKIHLNAKGIDSVEFLSVRNLLQPNGQVYPDSKSDPFYAADPESIRYNPKKNQLVWSSEGERLISKNTTVLQDPSVHIISTEGKFLDSFLLPENMRMKSGEKGPRQNGVFEGVSFANNFKKILVSVEEPLHEDAARAGTKDSAAWIRIIRFNARSRKPEAQYGYQIDPVAYAPIPSGGFKVNGISEILAVNKHRLLVVERSFSAGRRPATIKVFSADLSSAQNVSRYFSLGKTSFRPFKKKLLLNLDSLGIYTDNIEGITFGPVLPNGNKTLIFVSDNNFSEGQLTQFLLFEIE